MRVRGSRLIACAFVGALLVADGAGGQTPPHAPATVLGAWPVCEPSGARWVPCANAGTSRCVIVGDNEQSKQLFLFTPTGTGDLAADFKKIAFADGTKLKDIEAIDATPQGFVVFGSHSRKSFKKHCARDADRLVFALLTRHGDTLSGTVVQTKEAEWIKRVSTVAGCLKDLIVLPASDPGAAVAEKACGAISEADGNAETAKAACSNAFNIEGVVELPGADGQPRVWVGLRAPTIDHKAILLRLRDLAGPQFDAIALVAVDGGVRDLAYARGSLWVLSGPAADEDEAGKLWTVPASAVISGADLEGHREAANIILPAFSEGLAIDEEANQATIIVDGDRGDEDSAECERSAGQLRVALPPPDHAASP